MLLTQNEVLSIFTETSALLNGHFLLTSGRHSNVYFQCAMVLQYPVYMEQICEILAESFKSKNIDTVISPALGGIIVGQEVARQLKVRSIFTERENGEMKLRRGFKLSKGERVLVCEDVVTTGGSVFEVIDLVKKHDAIPVGVAFIVDRSNGAISFGIEQKSTITLDAKSYNANECPLCKENIPLIKPGSRGI